MGLFCLGGMEQGGREGGGGQGTQPQGHVTPDVCKMQELLTVAPLMGAVMGWRQGGGGGRESNPRCVRTEPFTLACPSPIHMLAPRPAHNTPLDRNSVRASRDSSRRPPPPVLFPHSIINTASPWTPPHPLCSKRRSRFSASPAIGCSLPQHRLPASSPSHTCLIWSTGAQYPPGRLHIRFAPSVARGLPPNHAIRPSLPKH